MTKQTVTSFQKRKTTVGREVLRRFERKVSQNLRLRTEETRQRTLEMAADLAYNMPFVTMPLRENGVLYGSNTKLLHAYRPGLWVQDHAYERGELGRMDIFAARERSEAAAEYSLETSPAVSAHLKTNGVSPDRFLKAMVEAGLIESAYQARISGEEMSESVQKKVDVALVIRAIKSGTGLKQICRSQGVDISDPVALLQLADTLDLTGGLREILDYDPYFKRRATNIAALASSRSTMNAEESVSLGATKIEEALFLRTLSKRKTEPWLKKAVSSLFGA